MALEIQFCRILPFWECVSDRRFRNEAKLRYEVFGREIQSQFATNTYQRTCDKYKVWLWGMQFDGPTRWCWFGQKYPGYYKVQCKCEQKYTNTNTQIQSRKYKYRHKYKYAVTTAVARSFRKLNSDGFWLLRKANRTPRSGVMPVWLFSPGVPSCGWWLLSRWKIEKI